MNFQREHKINHQWKWQLGRENKITFIRPKTEIEVRNNTALEILEENNVEFEYIKYDQIDECPLVDVAPILSSKKDKDSVSFHLHLTLEERPVVLTLSKYSSNGFNKKEVTENDSTGVIKIAFGQTALKKSQKMENIFLSV